MGWTIVCGLISLLAACLLACLVISADAWKMLQIIVALLHDCVIGYV